MTVKRYRTKPVEIEAMRCNGDNFWEVHKWSQNNLRKAITNSGRTETYQVYDRLHETWVNFESGDWIIRGLEGEYYPCVDSTFRAKYEEVVPYNPPADNSAFYDSYYKEGHQ